MKFLTITFIFFTFLATSQELFDTKIQNRSQTIFGLMLRSRVSEKLDINNDFLHFQNGIIGTKAFTLNNLWAAYRFNNRFRFLFGFGLVNRYTNDTIPRFINEYRPWLGFQYNISKPKTQHVFRNRNEFRIIDNTPTQVFRFLMRTRFDYIFKQSIIKKLNDDFSLALACQTEFFLNLNNVRTQTPFFEQTNLVVGLEFTIKNAWTVSLSYIGFFRPNFETKNYTIIHAPRLMLVKQFDFRKKSIPK